MKALNVFYDIETLTVNRNAKPTEQHPIEYVVTVIYETDKMYRFDFANLKLFIQYLIDMPKKYYFNLIAHNGGRFDAHFLRYTLINDFNLVPKTAYNRNSVVHTNEKKVGEQLGDYLLESRVKAKSNVSLKFKIGNNKFKTDDTLPKFQASIKTLGELLVHHNVIKTDDMKLDDYDYTRYDLNYDLNYEQLRDHAQQVFNQLTPHEYEYIHNDVYIMYMAWQNYKKIFPSFDIKKMTLSQNILEEYKVNDLATLQLLNKFDDININYSDYDFNGFNLYDYVHHFYKGGLNYYNDNYIGKMITGVKHIDKNSSYPYVMSTKQFPTFLLEAKIVNQNIELNPAYYYMVQLTKESFNKIIKHIPSIQIRKMLVKYFNNPTQYVYLSTPHLTLLSKMLKRPVNNLPVVSYLKWQTAAFGAHDKIDELYKIKTDNKIAGYSDEEIYVYKVLMNGIYGIPALRAYFNEFKLDENGTLYNEINGFKNNERNLVFASAVTAYSFQTLIEPLTHEVKGADKGFVYCDTDSLFLKADYYDRIIKNVNVDKYALSAWKVEHENIDKMYILNHKKYAFYDYRDLSWKDIAKGKKPIEVRCGGVPLESFNLNMGFELFVKTQFSKGAILNVKKGVYSRYLLPVMYEASTTIDVGSTYPSQYTPESTVEYSMALAYIAKREQDDGDADGLYYETDFGAIAINEAFPYQFKTDTIELKYLIRLYNLIKEQIL